MYNQILTEDTKTNKIGNFISLSVGSGGTVLKATQGWLFGGSSKQSTAPFRVNLASGILYATGAQISGTINSTGGTFSGTLVAATGSFSGTITASGGSITGDIDVTGKLIFKSGSSERGRIYCDSSKMYIQVGGSGKGCYFDTNGNFFAPNASMYVYNDIQSGHGSIYGYNDVYSTNGSVYSLNSDVYSLNGSVWAKNDIYTNNGSIRAYNDIRSNNGKVIAKDRVWAIDNGFRVGSGDGYDGKDYEDEIITSVFWSDNKLKLRARVYKCKGGIMISRGSENERTIHTF